MQNEPFGINSAADAANISAHRQAVCAEPRVEIVWNGLLALVHAQIFSTNRVPRSFLDRSLEGRTAFSPLGLLIGPIFKINRANSHNELIGGLARFMSANRDCLGDWVLFQWIDQQDFPRMDQVRRTHRPESKWVRRNRPTAQAGRPHKARRPVKYLSKRGSSRNLRHDPLRSELVNWSTS
jgi:hypothetical protein